MCCADSNYVHITGDIFRKEKRISELDPEDIMGNDTINIRFQVEGSESPQSSVPPNSVILKVDGSQSLPSFVSYNSVVPHYSVEVKVVAKSKSSQKQMFLKCL
jgi:hypothetical protein